MNGSEECYIHGWVEVFDDGKWVAVKPLLDEQLNYKRFAALAGVRHEGDGDQVTPKGIPDDVSDTTAYHIKACGEWGHSHSHMELKEASSIFLATAALTTAYAEEYPIDEYFDMDSVDLEHDDVAARLVFWFER